MNISILILILPLLIGFAIGFFTRPDNSYKNLKKAELNPHIYFQLHGLYYIY